jgi:hypothetical protein
LSEATFPEKNSLAVRAGKGDRRTYFAWDDELIGSMAFVVSLYALAISHSKVLTARRGTKHIPRCGSLDLCSSNAYRLSFSYL